MGHYTLVGQTIICTENGIFSIFNYTIIFKRENKRNRTKGFRDERFQKFGVWNSKKHTCHVSIISGNLFWSVQILFAFVLIPKPESLRVLNYVGKENRNQKENQICFSTNTKNSYSIPIQRNSVKFEKSI